MWKDQKTVNVMTTACFHKVTKVMVSALKFFLGSDEVVGEPFVALYVIRLYKYRSEEECKCYYHAAQFEPPFIVP